MRILRLSFFRLEALIIGLSLALFATAVAAQILFDRRSAIEQAKIATDTDARLISVHAEVVFRTADRIIQGTLDTVGDRDLDEIAASREIREVLRHFASNMVYGGSVAILDREGRLVVTTSPWIRPDVSFGDREYFRALASGAPRTIAQVSQGRLTGEPMIVIGRPIGSGESFRGVVIVGMPADYFSRFYGSIRRGPMSSVLLVGDDGRIIVRDPRVPDGGPDRIGRVMPPDIDHIISIGSSSIDGTERVAAMRRVPDQPLMVSAAVATDAVLTPWRHRSIALGGVTLLGIALLCAMAVVALRASGRERAALRDTRTLSDELAIALRRERMLRSELAHRTKNNLSMMIAMLQVEGRRPNVDRDAFLGTANRITALALAQQSLDHAAEGDIECAEYLGNIARVLADAEPHGRVRLSLFLEPVSLRAERAQALGLIANELMTNSIKYAFRDRPSGTVTLTLYSEDDEVVFEYEDDGPGFRGEARDDSKGLLLISSLCSTLRAHHTIAATDGMHFRLSFATDATEAQATVPPSDLAAIAPRPRSPVAQP